MEEAKDDLISRRAAIYIASGFCHPANIAKELAKLPSAQPEIKTDGDTISRQAAIDAVFGRSHNIIKQRLKNLPPAQPSDDYNRGWEDGRKALREEQWENGRDRLD